MQRQYGRHIEWNNRVSRSRISLQRGGGLCYEGIIMRSSWPLLGLGTLARSSGLDEVFGFHLLMMCTDLLWTSRPWSPFFFSFTALASLVAGFLISGVGSDSATFLRITFHLGALKRHTTSFQTTQWSFSSCYDWAIVFRSSIVVATFFPSYFSTSFQKIP